MAITLAQFTAQSAKLPTSNRASLSTRNSIPILSFPDDGTDRAAIFLGVMPATASLGSSLSILVRWMTPATSGDAVIGASIERDDSATDLDADSFDTEATVTTTAPGTSGFPATSTITFSLPADYDSLAAGEQFRLKIRAVTSSGSFTLGQALQVMSVMVQEPGTAGSGGSGGITRAGCRAYRSTNQSISHDTTTPVLFDVDLEDTDGFHNVSSNQDRFTIPAGLAGYYTGYYAIYMASNVTGVRQLNIIQKNSGDTQIDQQLWTFSPPGTSEIVVVMPFGFEMAVGDYLSFNVYQNSTVSLNVQPGGSTQRSICGFKAFRRFAT